MLSEYFTEMTKEVMVTDGVLDKFIGDAVMAFWGAPIEQPDQADRALKTAVNMMKRLKDLQTSWATKGLPILNIGIGINTGEVIAGTIGGGGHVEFTLIGDTTNVAARLQAAAPPGGILIGQATFDAVRDEVTAEPFGDLDLKGKPTPVRTFEVRVDPTASA